MKCAHGHSPRSTARPLARPPARSPAYTRAHSRVASRPPPLALQRRDTPAVSALIVVAVCAAWRRHHHHRCRRRRRRCRRRRRPPPPTPFNTAAAVAASRASERARAETKVNRNRVNEPLSTVSMSVAAAARINKARWRWRRRQRPSDAPYRRRVLQTAATWQTQKRTRAPEKIGVIVARCDSARSCQRKMFLDTTASNYKQTIKLEWQPFSRSCSLASYRNNAKPSLAACRPSARACARSLAMLIVSTRRAVHKPISSHAGDI